MTSIDTEKLYAQIGQLKVENDFLKKLHALANAADKKGSR
jgi:hypothetical protein